MAVSRAAKFCLVYAVHKNLLFTVILNNWQSLERGYFLGDIYKQLKMTKTKANSCLTLENQPL